MAKTLVIKNANFSAHKLDTVVFGTIPCTGITLSENTFTITDYNSVEIGCTLTPENTTDVLSWSSSDENVVTVNNGILTVIGIGTATITATCGEQTATATVNVSKLSIIPDWKFGYLAKASNVPFASYDNTAYSRIASFGKDEQKGDYQFGVYEGVDPVYVIKLPKGTNKVTVKRASDKASIFYNGGSGIFWMKDESSGSSNLPNTALYVSEETFDIKTNESVAYTVPENVDSIGVYVRLASVQQQTDDPNTIAETAGLTVEFTHES